MKVEELIEKLSKFDADCIVLRSIPETDGAHTDSIELLEFYETDFGDVIILK